MHLYAHHLVISGFRQHRGRLAGCDRVFARLQKFNRPGVRVEMLRWDTDWPSEAVYIERHAPPGYRPLVCLYAYSWGFGNGVVRLAEALARLESPIKVYGVVGCDAVYRHGYRCGNWRAFWPFARIRLPWNVDRRCVRLFHQTNSLPMGHVVVDHFGEPIRRSHVDYVHDAEGRAVAATHLNIDESAEWLEACDTLGQMAERVVKRKLPAIYQPEVQD